MYIRTATVTLPYEDTQHEYLSDVGTNLLLATTGVIKS